MGKATNKVQLFTEAMLWLRLAFVGLVLWTYNQSEMQLWLAGVDAFFGVFCLIWWAVLNLNGLMRREGLIQ